MRRLLPWLLNAVYVAVLTALAPVILWRRVRYGKYRDGGREKLLGRLPVSDGDEPVVWVHAVSVGEVLQLETILPGLQKQWPQARFLITATTATGLTVARARFPQHTTTYGPLDFSWAVNTAFDRVRPRLLILVELELWPNLILAANRLGISLNLINGRMSDRSFRGYQRVRRLIAPLLRSFTMIAAQTPQYAARLTELGAEQVHVTGSIKFDCVTATRNNVHTKALQEAFCIADRDLVLIAGSTQHPEETLALDAWENLRTQFPNLRLIVVPRHQERFDEVARMIVDRGLTVRRRTNAAATETVNDNTVMLLDTLGELKACWGLADIAFVGGSFGSRGGQNMIEPAAYGAAVLFGPKTSNFRDVVALLLDAEAAIRLNAESDFTPAVRALLADRRTRLRLGVAAQNIVQQHTGASKRTISLLAGSLPVETARSTPVRPAA